MAEDIDTTTPAGELIFLVFASIAHFERRRISERTREGLAAARKRGRIGGRPPALSNLRVAQVLLGHKSIESTTRYLGIKEEEAMDIAKQFEI